jgi:predicted ribosome quality control (RQC) complex YloA/Tae2 family protein
LIADASREPKERPRGARGSRPPTPADPLPLPLHPTQAARDAAATTGVAGGELHAALAAAVAGALRRARSAADAMARQAATADDEAGTRRLANLLVSNLHLVKQGMSEVTVDDWETGEKVSIPLDPALPPNLAAEALYKRARKQARASDAVAPRAADAAARIEGLEAAAAALAGLDPGADDGGASLARLLELRDELDSMQVRPPAAAAAGAASRGAAAAARAARKAGAKRRYRRFLSPGGFEVLLGRDNRENDELSLKSAAPHDVWLHARGVPGAHAVLRQPASSAASDPAPADLAFAASLAAYYSKARGATVADVSWTRAARVRKPRGAPPGAVALLDERVTVGVPRDGEASVRAAGESGGEGSESE